MLSTVMWTVLTTNGQACPAEVAEALKGNMPFRTSHGCVQNACVWQGVLSSGDGPCKSKKADAGDFETGSADDTAWTKHIKTEKACGKYMLLGMSLW